MEAAKENKVLTIIDLEIRRLSRKVEEADGLDLNDVKQLEILVKLQFMANNQPTQVIETRVADSAISDKEILDALKPEPVKTKVKKPSVKK